MSSDSLNEFSSWYNNPEQKAAHEKAMLMSGIPLEIKARRFLAKLGYRARRWYYATDSETWRELDFMAEKVVGQYTITLSEYPSPEESNIYFWIEIVGECKRSSTHDFFAFEAEQPERLLEHSIYPIPFYEYKIEPPHSFVIGSLNSLLPPLKPHYSFPFVTERIVEVDAANYKKQERRRSDDNYNDKRTHEACETLLSASISLKQGNQHLVNIVTQQLFAAFEREYLEITKQTPSGTPEEVAKKLVEIDPKQVWKKLGLLSIVWGVPLIVLDDNRGLIATHLRADSSVEFGADIGFEVVPSELLSRQEREVPANIKGKIAFRELAERRIITKGLNGAAAWLRAKVGVFPIDIEMQQSGDVYEMVVKVTYRPLPPVPEIVYER